MTEWGSFKPLLTALAMPPVPMLVMVLWGALRWRQGRRAGAFWLALGLGLLWLACCNGAAVFLQDRVLQTPPALGEAQRQALADRVRKGPPTLAVIALGGGMQPLAPEYGVASLTGISLERLRYGVWLSRQLRAPLGFSGGIGWAQKGQADGAGEAEVAARIARQEYGLSMRWVESASADTRANAEGTVAMLAEQGVQDVVLVTSAFHLKRAVREFERAAAHRARTHPGEAQLRITPAGTAYWRQDMRTELEWLPSASGFWRVHAALREGLGLLVMR
jgi:uncharacterized SAM-binding protein YcdF (DUF218 family)